MFSAPVTGVITLATVLTSILAFSNGNVYYRFLYNPYQVKHSNEYYRLLSHTLIHADWGHLAFNMIAFFSFGSFMEEFLGAAYGVPKGRILLLVLYIGGALIASVPGLRKHGDNPNYNAVGASGAVSAVMMAFMIMFPLARISFFFAIPMPAYIGALLFLGLEHYLQKRGGTNIAHDAHIWGALGGFIFVLFMDAEYITGFFRTIAASWGL